MSASKAVQKFAKDEKVLCFHGPLMYNAKILDVKYENDEYLYFIHYVGWSKTWDEWVKDTRIFKDDEEGKRTMEEVSRLVKTGKKQKVLRKSELKKNPEPPSEIMEHLGISQDHASEPESMKSEEHDYRESHDDEVPVSGSSLKPEGETNPTLVPSKSSQSSSRKRRNRTTGDTDEGLLQRIQIDVKLTEVLMAFLADDWDMTTKQSHIVSLPSRKPITAVFEEYLEYSNSKPPCTDNSPFNITHEFRAEFVEGIRINFNNVVGSQLLYKFERPQYAELVRTHADKEMVDLYGPTHLLRFMLKLRDYVTFLKNDKTSAGLLEALAADFVGFLDQNRSTYFKLDDYVGVSPDYLREAMC
ncbi:hypothetical protein Aperf_G00000100424 [Anoplocephala perfoliata]